LGRFTRLKEKQRNAYLFQFCECAKHEYSELVESIIKNCLALGITKRDFESHVHIANNEREQQNGKITIDLSNMIINYEELKNKILMRMCGDNVRKLIILTNNKIIGERNVADMVNENKLIDTKKKLIHYLEDNNISEEIYDQKNWVKYCLGNKNFELLKKYYYYSMDDFIASCHTLKIMSVAEYKENRAQDYRLPSLKYLYNGFYYDLCHKFGLINIFNNFSQVKWL